MSENPFSPYTREMVAVLSKMDHATFREWIDEIRAFISYRAGRDIQSIHDYLTAPDSKAMPEAERFQTLMIIVQALKARDLSFFHAMADSPGDQPLRPEPSG